jgi:hypothetical protein
MKKLLLILSLVWWTACGTTPTATRQELDGGSSPALQTKVAGRIFQAQVGEKNLVLKSEVQARDYLRKKLVGLVAQKLFELGTDTSEAARLASGGRLEAFRVNGHEERVHGQGAEKGLIKKMVLWDVTGKLIVELDDAAVAELVERLAGLPAQSMEEIDALERFLVRLPALEPDQETFTKLRRRVGDRWAELLAPWMKVQLDIPVELQKDYLQALARIAVVLKDFKQAHATHPGFASLEKSFILAALKLLRTIPVGPARFKQINELLAELGGMAKQSMPGLIPYLKRDLELAWRDFLVKRDDAEAAFSETKDGFLYFLELFPKSKFYPDLELRFLTRWYEHLLVLQANDLKGLFAFQREARLLSERFPGFTRVADVRLALGKQCVKVLSAVEGGDLKAMAEIKQAREGCDPVVAAGNETVQMRDRLERMEQRLVDARDDKLEEEALADLTFFIEWDKAIGVLPWAKKNQGWQGRGVFADKWKKGEDAGPDCRCTLDPDEPCRAFEQEGPAGGFEVVARFFSGKLSSVDLCQVYTGSQIESVYRFFARRYKKRHSGKQAATFLAGSGGAGSNRGVRFEKPGELEIVLERSTDTCTVRYRSQRMLAAMKVADKAEQAVKASERAVERKKRIAEGWRPGQCVRWDCEPVCKYRGRAKTRGKGRYLVTITDAKANRRKEGSDVWVKADRLFDCE